MESIQTTGGLYTSTIQKEVIIDICSVFSCKAEDISELMPLQAGLTNIVLSFKCNGGKFIFRYPGLGSEILVDRGRETIMQAVVAEVGIDPTLVAMDANKGWKVAKYVEHHSFDYHNMNDMVRGIMLLRKLHETTCRVRWDFDVIKQAERIKEQIPSKDYGHFEDFDEIKADCYQLYDFANRDRIPLCYVHGDARDENFLINKDEIYLTDWEYGGYGDPGFDIGSYICGGVHSDEDIDRILFSYYRHQPTFEQKRHCYAYLALTGWFFLHWSMLKESEGQNPEPLKSRWYGYIQRFRKIALKMYEKEAN